MSEQKLTLFKSENEKLGYKNEQGKIIIPAQYENANDFINGFAAASSDGKWGFIDKRGKRVVPFIYHEDQKLFRPSGWGLGQCHLVKV